jgi:hypothetical protein
MPWFSKSNTVMGCGIIMERGIIMACGIIMSGDTIITSGHGITIIGVITNCRCSRMEITGGCTFCTMGCRVHSAAVILHLISQAPERAEAA